jgi:glycosyltransferase involved in cell wall biosynthesis
MNEPVSTNRPLVSIVINNYNYERFLAQSIDSALSQTYPHVEVIVVDDGSTDRSREILASYDRQIMAIYQSNGGQAAAINAGIAAAGGEIICLLDADDLFTLDKIERVVELFARDLHSNSAKILHNSFAPIDRDGCLLPASASVNILAFPRRESTALAKFIRGYNADTFFTGELNQVCHADGLYEFARRYRYVPYLGMPTSSISMSRLMAERLFPLPVDGFKISADELIVKAAGLVGAVYSTNLILTEYRLHGHNNWHGKSMTTEQEKLAGIQRDRYLNTKLESVGKVPVCCFLNSMQADGFYRLHFGASAGDRLVALAINVIRWHIDTITLSFFVETLMRGLYYKFRTLVRSDVRA